MSTPASAWLAAFAERLGVDALSTSEVDEILAMAGIAAHASERTAAPVACWLAARVGITPGEALEVAREIQVVDSDRADDATDPA